MKELRLRDFVNKFQGQKALVIGDGPTHYDYLHIRYHEGPIILINHAIKIAGYAPHNPNIFFFSLHLDDFEALGFLHQPMTPFITFIPNEHVKRINSFPYRYVRYNWKWFEDGGFKPQKNGLVTGIPADREWLAEHDTLCGVNNTTTFALHFLYLCGIVEADCVGMYKIDGEYRAGHDPRLDDNQQDFAFVMVLAVTTCCAYYGIKTNFLGTEKC